MKVKNRKFYILKNGYTFQDRGKGSTARLYKTKSNPIGDPYCMIHDEDVFKDFIESSGLIKEIK